jgi:glycosyltransferase involved in cell wall biosynthesis
MPDPSISVLMTVRDRATYLDQAIESVLAQTEPDFEFIVVGDGASPEVAGKVAGWAARDPRIRFLDRPHAGVGAASNAGVAAARGRYIARIDDDDVALPHRFDVQRRFLDANPGVALVGSAFQRIDTAGNVLGVVRYPTEHAAIRRRLRCDNPICHSTVMMRREAVLAVGNYRRPFRRSLDFDLWLRMVERFELRNLPDVLVQYRVHRNNVTSSDLAASGWCPAAAWLAAELRRGGEPDGIDGIQRLDADSVRGMCRRPGQWRRVLAVYRLYLGHAAVSAGALALAARCVAGIRPWLLPRPMLRLWITLAGRIGLALPRALSGAHGRAI